MREPRYTVEVIVAKLREAEFLLAKGQTLAEVVRESGAVQRNRAKEPAALQGRRHSRLISWWQ